MYFIVQLCTVHKADYGNNLWTAVIHENYLWKLGNIMAINFAVPLFGTNKLADILPQVCKILSGSCQECLDVKGI